MRKFPFSSTDVRLGLYPWGVPPASQSEKARRYEGEWQNHRQETEDKRQRERLLGLHSYCGIRCLGPPCEPFPGGRRVN